MSEGGTKSLLQWLHLGLLARKYAVLRFRLMQVEARKRGRQAGLALGLLVLAGMFVLLALGLGLAAAAWELQIAGYSWPAALLLTAMGAILVAVALTMGARALMLRATRH